mmetsp:Transcript_58434/g.189236  ORF Transcript_58434/g.189236 Transcript_58434/m.189236 type:complete len:238 (+) Transcript_58434:639-1352(+)
MPSDRIQDCSWLADLGREPHLGYQPRQLGVAPTHDSRSWAHPGVEAHGIVWQWPVRCVGTRTPREHVGQLRERAAPLQHPAQPGLRLDIPPAEAIHHQQTNRRSIHSHALGGPCPEDVPCQVGPRRHPRRPREGVGRVEELRAVPRGDGRQGSSPRATSDDDLGADGLLPDRRPRPSSLRQILDAEKPNVAKDRLRQCIKQRLVAETQLRKCPGEVRKVVGGELVQLEQCTLRDRLH